MSRRFPVVKVALQTHSIAVVYGRADLARLIQRTLMGFPDVVGVVWRHEPVAGSHSIPVVDSDVEFRCPDLGALDDVVMISIFLSPGLPPCLLIWIPVGGFLGSVDTFHCFFREGGPTGCDEGTKHVQ